MRTKDEYQMLPLLLSTMLVLFIVGLLSSQVEAREANMACTTSHGEYAFKVDKTSVGFLDQKSNRAISSERKIETTQLRQGFIKSVELKNDHYEIHVADINSPSEVDDYLSITSSKGKKIVYPLHCYKI